MLKDLANSVPEPSQHVPVVGSLGYLYSRGGEAERQSGRREGREERERTGSGGGGG